MHATARVLVEGLAAVEGADCARRERPAGVHSWRAQLACTAGASTRRATLISGLRIPPVVKLPGYFPSGDATETGIRTLG